MDVLPCLLSSVLLLFTLLQALKMSISVVVSAIFSFGVISDLCMVLYAVSSNSAAISAVSVSLTCFLCSVLSNYWSLIKALLNLQ